MKENKERKIEDLLDSLGIPVANLGYKYLVTAMNNKIFDENSTIEDIYIYIAV